jgi:carbon-monoxide dehydrogenase iron sulfur subunit
MALLILRNTDKCYGCRTCQLICSFHHKGHFEPESSSIKVNRDYKTSVIRWSIDSTCDGCKGESEPLCVKYCCYNALSTPKATTAEGKDRKTEEEGR